MFHGEHLYVANEGSDEVLRYGALYVASVANDAVLRYDGATGAPSALLIEPGAGGLDTPTHITLVPAS